MAGSCHEKISLVKNHVTLTQCLRENFRAKITLSSRMLMRIDLEAGQNMGWALNRWRKINYKSLGLIICLLLKHADKQIILYIGFVFCGWLQKYDKTSVFYNQIKNTIIKECRKRANLPLFLACAAVLAWLWVIVNPKEEKRLKTAEIAFSWFGDIKNGCKYTLKHCTRYG